MTPTLTPFSSTLAKIFHGSSLKNPEQPQTKGHWGKRQIYLANLNDRYTCRLWVEDCLERYVLRNNPEHSRHGSSGIQPKTHVHPRNNEPGLPRKWKIGGGSGEKGLPRCEPPQGGSYNCQFQRKEFAIATVPEKPIESTSTLRENRNALDHLQDRTKYNFHPLL